MRRCRYVLFALTVSLVCLATDMAQAQAAEETSPPQPPEARELGQRVMSEIERGGISASRLGKLYRVLGVAQAHLGDADGARRAFVCALALDPSLRLPNTDPVEVRSPFMEARGFWSLHPERLNASAMLSQDAQALLLTVIDPAALAARVLVRARALGQTTFVEWALAPEGTVRVSLETLRARQGVELSLALLDENGNRLWQRGSDTAPIRLESASVRAPEPSKSVAHERADVSAPDSRTTIRSARPFYISASLSFVLSAGAGSIAAVAHAERERLARRWNRGDCAGTGTTRGEVCNDEHQHMLRNQRLAIGFYALAAAGLAAGIATLIAAPARDSRARGAVRAGQVSCASGPGLWGLSCSTRF